MPWIIQQIDLIIETSEIVDMDKIIPVYIKIFQFGHVVLEGDIKVSNIVLTYISIPHTSGSSFTNMD